MRVVGLTGGIGTGKSTVARMLRERHGVHVVDADQVARDIVAPPSLALNAIVKAFGPSVLLEDGTLDRAAMRARISTDNTARATLNQIMHPAIGAEVTRRLGAMALAAVEVAVVEAALMVEAGTYHMYDTLVVVSCSPKTQLQRVVSRDGMTLDGAKSLIATQMPMAEKEAVADHVIRNDGDLFELQAQVDTVWTRFS